MYAQNSRFSTRQNKAFVSQERHIESQLANRRVQKDFLKENVKRLKEIQSKYRSNTLSSQTQNIPLKAIRSNVSQPSSKLGNKRQPLPFLQTERINSAHSDYFSISDDPPTVHSTQAYDPRNYKSPHIDDAVSFVPDSYRLSSTLTKGLSQSMHSLHIPSSATPPNEPNFRKVIPSMHVSMCHASTMTGKSKVSSLLEKVKSKRPSCESDTNSVWQDIEEGHKALNRPQNALMSLNMKTAYTASDACLNYPNKFDTRVTKSPSLQNLHKPDSLKYLQVEKDIVSLPTPSAVGYNGSSKSIDNSSDIYTKNIIKSSSIPNIASDDDCVDYEISEDHPDFLSSKSGQETPIALTDVEQKTDATLHAMRDKRNIRNTDAAQLQKARNLRVEKEIKQNIFKPNIQAAARQAYLKRSKSSGNLKCSLPPTYRIGEIPRYLQIRRAEEERKRRDAPVFDPFCPPGHTLLPDEERKNTLEMLLKGQKDTLQQLSRLPLIQETMRVKRQSQELEAKLTRIEEGIEVFSQSRVYVVDDE